MKGLNPNPKTDQELRENLRVLTELSEELYFKPTFNAGDGYFTAGVNLAAGTIPGCVTVELTNAAGPISWSAQRRRRARWRNAAVRVTLIYSAAVGSTNGFHVDLRTREHDAGDVHPVADVLLAGITLPGPAVAFTEMSYVYVSPTAAINGAKPNLSFIHTRNPVAADDTNANSLHILSAEWEIIPL